MASFCDKCGAELKDGVRFCNKCGAKVNVSDSTSGNFRGAMMICPHCGQQTPAGQVLCENCGSSLEDNKVAVIAGYIVTFLVPILGFIPAIYLLTRKNDKSKTQGVFLIAVIMLMIILNLILHGWITYVIIFIVMLVGVVLWLNDFTLF